MKDWGKLFIESNTMNAFKATFMESEGRKYLFLDFDDTVRESVMYGNEGGPPVEVSQVKAFPGVGGAIQKWMDNGWTVIGATNQKGSLRRKEFIPEPERNRATLEDAAVGCGNVIKETLNQLGVNFPVLFASDATVFLYTNGRVAKVAKFGEEEKGKGNAPKPSPAMGQVAFSQWGKPDLAESFMIGDSYEGGDENFAKAIGVQWLHPGPLGRDFIEYTNQKFSEEIEETGGYIADVPFYGTHQY
jgi:histidinol phosphatase-like enzyme